MASKMRNAAKPTRIATFYKKCKGRESIPAAAKAPSPGPPGEARAAVSSDVSRAFRAARSNAAASEAPKSESPRLRREYFGGKAASCAAFGVGRTAGLSLPPGKVTANKN